MTWNGHGDALGLYRIESSGSLTLANSYTYSTWGKPTTATHNSIADLGFRFLYVGAADVQWDSSYGLDLLYMHVRHYSPSLGRFLQPDSSRLDAKLFVYAANGPVSGIDPSGRVTWYFLGRKFENLGPLLRLLVSGGITYACFRVSPWVTAGCVTTSWLLTEKIPNMWKAREAWYSSTGYAKVVYRPAVWYKWGLGTVGYQRSGFIYKSGSVLAAKRCAECILGWRSAWEFRNWCGDSPYSSFNS